MSADSVPLPAAEQARESSDLYVIYWLIKSSHLDSSTAHGLGAASAALTRRIDEFVVDSDVSFILKTQNDMYAIIIVCHVDSFA